MSNHVKTNLSPENLKALMLALAAIAAYGIIAYANQAHAASPAAEQAFVDQCTADAKQLGPTRVVFGFDGFNGFDADELKKLKNIPKGTASIYDIFPTESADGNLLRGTLRPTFINRLKTAWYYFPQAAVNGKDETPAFRCVKAWAEARYPQDNQADRQNEIILVGYSFGGQTVSQLAQQLGSQVKITYVVTIDPVPKYFMGSISKPANVVRWISFIQKNQRVLSGYPVTNVDQEFDLTSGGYDHPGIPYAPEIRDQIVRDLDSK